MSPAKPTLPMATVADRSVGHAQSVVAGTGDCPGTGMASFCSMVWKTFCTACSMHSWKISSERGVGMGRRRDGGEFAAPHIGPPRRVFNKFGKFAQEVAPGGDVQDDRREYGAALRRTATTPGL